MRKSKAQVRQRDDILLRHLQCTDAGSFSEWAKGADPEMSVVRLFAEYCGDCTAEYQAEMIAEGRCLRCPMATRFSSTTTGKTSP